MILEKLVLHNFGVFRDRQEIDLAPSCAERPVVLFGGLNGAGKTTILDAIQLSLYGKHTFGSARADLSYPDYLRRCINRESTPEEGAGIELQFQRTVDGAPETIRVQRYWRFTPKSGLREKVEVLHNGRPDRYLSQHWDERVEDFLPRRIAKLCFFDGEKIESLASLDESGEIVRTAIHALLGLEIVDRLSTDLQVLERKERMSSADAEELERITALEQQVTELKTERKRLKEEFARIRSHVIDRREKELAEADEAFRREGGERLERESELRSELRELERERKQIEAELGDIASGPLPLLSVLPLVRATRQQASREAVARRESAVLEVLEERDRALLEALQGHKVSAPAKKHIEEYLRDDRKQRVESTSGESYLDADEETVSQLIHLDDGDMDGIRARVSELVTRLSEIEEDTTERERALESVPDADTLEDLVERRTELRAAIDRAHAESTLLSESLERVEAELGRMETVYSRALETGARKQQELEDTARLLSHSSRARKTLQKFRSKILERNVARIETAVLESFQMLLRKERLVSSLAIDPDTYQISLQNGSSKPLDSDRLSAGERQLLAVSLLWGLARASGRPLPVVVDTPLGRLDSSHRRNLVERYFPFASHQVLLLSTDEEINEAHVDRLKSHIGRSYRLEFDEGSSSTTVRPGYFWEGVTA